MAKKPFSEILRENIIPSVLVAFILALLGGLYTLGTNGVLISWMGGVSKDELRETLKGLKADDDATPLLAFQNDIASFEDRIKGLEDTMKGIPGHVEALMERSDKGDADHVSLSSAHDKLREEYDAFYQFEYGAVVGYFDGFVQMRYLKSTYLICPVDDCPSTADDGTEVTDTEHFTSENTVKFEIDLEATHGINGEFFVMNWGVRPVDNKFQTADGSDVNPEIEYVGKGNDLEFKVSIGPHEPNGYTKVQIFYVVAFHDTINLSPGDDFADLR